MTILANMGGHSLRQRETLWVLLRVLIYDIISSVSPAGGMGPLEVSSATRMGPPLRQ
jgi:hypothetical protein